ncbi:MAG: hypothetical protein [Caudoviricetes sp.]|nr:MAG: hypothetical protein [Caudoviricetes sp.]
MLPVQPLSRVCTFRACYVAREFGDIGEPFGRERRRCCTMQRQCNPLPLSFALRLPSGHPDKQPNSRLETVVLLITLGHELHVVIMNFEATFLAVVGRDELNDLASTSEQGDDFVNVVVVLNEVSELLLWLELKLDEHLFSHLVVHANCTVDTYTHLASLVVLWLVERAQHFTVIVHRLVTDSCHELDQRVLLNVSSVQQYELFHFVSP